MLLTVSASKPDLPQNMLPLIIISTNILHFLIKSGRRLEVKDLEMWGITSSMQHDGVCRTFCFCRCDLTSKNSTQWNHS